MMTSLSNAKHTRAAMAVVALAAAVVLAVLAFTPAAYANKQLDAPTTVSDDITRLHVNKLDADTHDYVQGASMAIIEKDTGTVVDEWVTGDATHENEKGLDVDKVYILREVAAPDGYDAVEDTEFVVNATEGTGITVLSGPAELTESYKVNLYDKAQAVENIQYVTQTRPATDNSTSSSESSSTDSSSSSNTATTDNGKDTTSKTVAPKTGDETPLMPIAVLVAMGVVAIVLLEIPKRRMGKE